jgi:hypothetical protein
MPAPISITSNTGRLELSSFAKVPDIVHWGTSEGSVKRNNSLILFSTDHRAAGRQDEVTVDASSFGTHRYLGIPFPAMPKSGIDENPTNWSVTSPLTRVLDSAAQVDLASLKRVKMTPKEADKYVAKTGAMLLHFKGARKDGYYVVDRPLENPVTAELLDAAAATLTAVAH